MKEKEKRRGRRRRRREEEEEEIKPRYGTLDYCMETTLSMDFVWITWNFKALYGKYLVSKSRVLIELHHNLRFLEIKVGKTHKEQDKYGILPLLLGSWLIGRKLS